MTNETKILDAWKVFQRAEKALVEASAGGTRGKALAKEITDRSEAREALLSLLEPGKVYEVADRVGIAAATESGFLLADLELVDVRERSADTRRIFYVEGKLTDETFERLKAAIGVSGRVASDKGKGYRKQMGASNRGVPTPVRSRLLEKV